MAKERSNNSRYPSRYSPNIGIDGFAWVTGRQYIVELVCENKALQDKYQTGSIKRMYPVDFILKT